MSDMDINRMDFKQLRNEVQYLRDELAMMQRKYEDILYNLDDENFSSRIVKEKGDMKAQIKITEEEISTKVSNDSFESAMIQTAAEISTKVSNDSFESAMIQTAAEITTKVSNTDLRLELEKYSKITQTAEQIALAVYRVEGSTDEKLQNYATIDVTNSKISAAVTGNNIASKLNNYLTGIEISPNSIKMIDGKEYSVYNSDGLRFYDSSNQVEGWSIEPDSAYGGVLNYYINGGNCYRFGTGESGEGYTYTDMSIKAINGLRGRFVVDVTNSAYKEVKFVGLSAASTDTPHIYANEKLLATQAWVSANNVAVFG